MAWRVAGAVSAWHQQLKAGYPYAAPPSTAAVAWGTIGDLDHTSTSDHSPHDFPGWGSDIVTAGDAPHVPALGMDMTRVTEAMRLSRDPRVKYVIFNRRIYSSYGTGTRAPWAWGPYSNAASDPHTDHAHLSVVGDVRGDDSRLWQIGVPVVDLTVSSGPQAILQGQTNGAVLKSMLGLLLMAVGGEPKRDDMVVWKTSNKLFEQLRAQSFELSDEDRAAIVADLKAAVVAELAELLPSPEDIKEALDAAIEERLNGATIRTAGH